MNYESKGIYIGLGLAVIVLILLIAFFKLSCNNPSKNDSKQHSIDSLNIIRAIEKKQAGKEIAILLNEVTRLQKEKVALNQQKDSIKQHERKLIVTNTSLINKLRQNAPKECQTYIDSCDEYHKQIEAVKDAAYDKQAEELCKADQSNENLMKIIGIKDMESVKDSINYAMNIDKLEADNKDKAKKLKRAKFWGKLAVGAAVVYTGVVMWLTVVK